MDKLGAGESVEVRTVHDTLSTTEAAEILNVSRPYVVKLLDQGLIPFEATEGNHRRMKRADLLEFQRQKDEERRGWRTNSPPRGSGSIASTVWSSDVARKVALYDACVLYPFYLRDLLVRLALADLSRRSGRTRFTTSGFGTCPGTKASR